MMHIEVIFVFEKIEKWQHKESGKYMYRYVPYNMSMPPVQSCDLIETVYLHNESEGQKEYDESQQKTSILNFDKHLQSGCL